MNDSENTTVVSAASGLDKAKVWLALLLLAGGIVAFYLLGKQPEWQRWLIVIAGLALAVLVFANSYYGSRLWRFVIDSRVELRKVVWPNRQETLMTTLVIFGFMAITGLGFWLLDLALAWVTRRLTGQGG